VSESRQTGEARRATIDVSVEGPRREETEMTEMQNPDRTADEDVEAHRLLKDRVQTDDEDVEGHRLLKDRVQTDDEGDVEGHRFMPGHNVQPGYDEDDTEGRRPRPF
jgi:hypothetical protein